MEIDTLYILSNEVDNITGDKLCKDDNFGTGPYFNIKQDIILKKAIYTGKGLFATKYIQKNTIVWHHRKNGPAESYKIVNYNNMKNYDCNTQEYIIKYGYQINDNEVITPLTQEEVDLDYSNYWNHSCDPNCLPYNEDFWIAVKDINIDEELTIDYCTFDCNDYYCIENCLCGTDKCRTVISNKDYLNKDIIKRYRKNFLPYIQNKIEKYYKLPIDMIF
jgi:hypothetical protein